MNTERKIQAGLEAAGEELSQYAYLQDVILKGEEEQIPGADNYAKDFCKNLAGAAAGIYAQLRVQDHVDTRQVIFMNALQSSVLEEWRNAGSGFELSDTDAVSSSGAGAYQPYCKEPQKSMDWKRGA